MNRGTADVEGFDALLETIERRLGFETGFYHDGYLRRRIISRMRRTAVDSFGAYCQLLLDDPEEGEALLDALSITVTNFFRNPPMWEAVRPILRELTDGTGPGRLGGEGRVRLWSAPCADGREPYSLAMLALDDEEIDADRVRITGTDINEDVLAVARRGRYRSSRTTDIERELAPLEDHERFVEREGATFSVRPEVRALVDFERHDLIRDDPPGEFDLVLCRNLLIYIDASYKRPIFETLSAAIRPGGVLVIGMTETIPPGCRDRFEAVDKRRRIYRIP